MISKFNASISFDTKSNHPDSKDVKGLVFKDTYTVDTDCFYDRDAITSYIKHDLALIAGGGYDTNTITNVKFNISAA